MLKHRQNYCASRAQTQMATREIVFHVLCESDKTALVKVETHRKTCGRVLQYWDHICIANSAIKSLEQRHKYQWVLEKQHCELNCKLTLSRQGRGKVRFLYPIYCGFQSSSVVMNRTCFANFNAISPRASKKVHCTCFVEMNVRFDDATCTLKRPASSISPYCRSIHRCMLPRCTKGFAWQPSGNLGIISLTCISQL